MTSFVLWSPLTTVIGDTLQTLLFALLLFSLAGCDSPQQLDSQIRSKRLTQLAQRAKAEGKQSIETSFTVTRDTKSTLRDVLEDASIVVVTPVRHQPRVHVAGDFILTAQDFRVARWLRRAPASPTECTPWPGVTVDESLVTTPLAKGTVVVDGISITEITESDMLFPEEQRYLLLVRDCSGRRLDFQYGANSVFIVTADDQIVAPSFNQPLAPFVNELAEVKTISALEGMIHAATAIRD